MVLTAKELGIFFKQAKTFDKVLKNVKIISLADGKCTAELKVEEEHSNILGGLHGGVSATLVDCISSYGLASHKYGGVPNVSVNINIDYINGAKTGDEIQILSDTIKVGKTLAFLEVLIKNKATGKLLVKASHTKFLMYPASSE